MKLNFAFALASILFGLLLYLEPIVILLTLMIISFILFFRYSQSPDKFKLAKLLVVGGIVRVVFAFLVFIYSGTQFSSNPIISKITGHTGAFFRDYNREVMNGMGLSDYFLMEKIPSTREVQFVAAIEGRTTYLHSGAYAHAFVNMIFGESPFNLIVFVILSLWITVLTYHLARLIFDPKTAYLSAALVTFMPTMILWPTVNFRMTLGIMGLLFILWALIQLSERLSIPSLISLVAGLLIFDLGKDNLILPLIAIVFFIFFLNLKIPKTIKITIFVIGIILMTAHPQIKNRMNPIIRQMATSQRDYTQITSGQNYKIYDERVYGSDFGDSKVAPMLFIKALPKGLTYFFLSPILWKTNNSLRLSAYPQTLFIYGIYLFALLGLLVGFRNHWKFMTSFFIFSSYWIILLALSSGNEGTVARHRELVMPLLMILGSAGFLQFLSYFGPRKVLS